MDERDLQQTIDFWNDWLNEKRSANVGEFMIYGGRSLDACKELLNRQHHQKPKPLTSEQLRECPFCGGEAFVHIIEPHKHMAIWMPDYDGGAFIECTGCECGMSGKTRSEVTAAWNRRHSPKPEALTLEQLREMDGEPVYCKGVVNAGLTDWGIVNAAKRKIYDGNGDFWDFDECGETFLVYATKPETEGD